MKTRITLSVDPETSERARRLARERNTTVSGLFSEFVGTQEGLAAERFVEKWAGHAVVRENPGDVRYEYLRQKYLR